MLFKTIKLYIIADYFILNFFPEEKKKKSDID